MNRETLMLFRSQFDFAKGSIDAYEATAKHVEAQNAPADANWVTRLEARVHQCEAAITPVFAFIDHWIDQELESPGE